jgi:copper resistance protein B
MLVWVGADDAHAQASPPAPRSAAEQVRERDDDAGASLPASIRPVTDEDRKVAFPDVGGHPNHDPIRYFVLFDQLEWQAGEDASGVNVDATAWIGRARNRLWLRLDGGSEDGRVDDAGAHVLFGRQFARWWDVVGGIRQDIEPGSALTWAAFGVQGLAPYWFEVEATGYVGDSGRTQARAEVEYELLLTNRLILQPRAEVNVFGKSDPERGVGAGLATTDFGVRVRYEFKREIAPYVGVAWRNLWGETADLAEADGKPTGGPRLVVGIRFWQ